jgi:nucleoside-diphosphate-sugar epimerase
VLYSPPAVAMKTVIIGCGYAGRVLARRLVARGDPVRATTTTETKLASLATLGAEPVLFRADKKETLARTMKDAEAVVYLAPPSKDHGPEEMAKAIAEAAPRTLRTLVYGSSTGVYGKLHDPELWVDETTPPRADKDRGKERLDMERALAAQGLPLKIVRIAGIYGPGRTLRDQIRRESLLVFAGGGPTSRIHVEDLSRILEAMTLPASPPIALACDEEPAPTLDVACYTCLLLGLQPPAPITIEDAKRIMSPSAIELRLNGHRCRSLVRKRLIGALEYPTYREGVRASLEAEGALPVEQ